MNAAPRPLRTHVVLAALAACLAIPFALPAASAGEVFEHVVSGETLSGTTEPGVTEVVPLHLTEGTLVDLDVRMAPGAAPSVVLLDPDLVPNAILPSLVRLDAKSARLTAKKVPVSRTGRHFVVLRPGTDGDYALKVKTVPQKKGAYAGLVLLSPPSEIPVGGAPGALLTVTAKRGSKSGLRPLVHRVRAPDGSLVDLSRASKRTTNEKVDSLKALPLDLLGTHVIEFGTQDGSPGDAGTLSWSVKYPKVRPQKRDDADLVVDPVVIAVDPPMGFDNLAYEGLVLSGDFIGPSPSVRLEGPGGTIQATGVVRVGEREILFDADVRGIPVGNYDVVVSQPDGAEGRRRGGFVVAGAPVPTSLSPPVGFDNGTYATTILGSRFQPTLVAVLVPVAGGPEITGVTGDVTATTAAVEFALDGAALGIYDVVVTNPDTGVGRLASGYQVKIGPRLQSIAPAIGHDNVAGHTSTLAGLHFQPGMAARLEAPGRTTLHASVAGVTATSAQATWDLRGQPAALRTVRVTNPDGGTAILEEGFDLRRAPRVDAITPNRAFDTESFDYVVVQGAYFQFGASARLEQGGVETAPVTDPAVTGGVTSSSLTGKLSVVGAPGGAHDVRVTNPDGGTEIRAAGFHVMGTVPFGSAQSMGRPDVIWNPDRNEYLVVYAVSDGTQRDLRARRIDAVTGVTKGGEILLTQGPEDQWDPAGAWAPSLGKYLIASCWLDPSSESYKATIRAQLVNGDGSINTDEEFALRVLQKFDGEPEAPRVAWNPDRSEWLVVCGWSRTDVFYACYDKGTDYGGILVPNEISSGTLVRYTHTVSGHESPVEDFEYGADIAYSTASKEYLVAVTRDVNEQAPVTKPPTPPPPDSGRDVSLLFFDGSFAGGPTLRATITNVASETDRDETRPRVAWSAATGRFLVAWEAVSSTGTSDVRCRLMQASNRTAVGTAFTVADGTASEDCRGPAIAFDPTTSAQAWLVAYAVGGGAAGTSRIDLTRLPVISTGSGLGTPAVSVLAPAVTGAGFDECAVGARGTGKEHLGAWIVTGSGKPGVIAEYRIAR